MMNMMKAQQMQAAIQGAGQEVAGKLGGGQPQQGKPNGAPPQQTGGPKQPDGGKPQEHGGQIPKNPMVRQQRAVKGQASKPHRPQPSEGNQYHQKRLT
jgi:hypothetical protein